MRGKNQSDHRRIFHVIIKSDIISEDLKLLWSYILGVLEDKIGLVCWQLPHEIYATEFFEFNLPVNFLIFFQTE